LQARWYRRPGRAVVTVVDLDRFIYINDRHRLLVGDDVLAEVERHTGPSRPSDRRTIHDRAVCKKLVVHPPEDSSP
jgi:predicted signal transduction protein with EAL and GGDEF domain